MLFLTKVLPMSVADTVLVQKPQVSRSKRSEDREAWGHMVVACRSVADTTLWYHTI